MHRSILFVALSGSKNASFVRQQQLASNLQKLGWDTHIALPDSENCMLPFDEHTEISEDCYHRVNLSARNFNESLRSLSNRINPEIFYFLNPKEKATLFTPPRKNQKLLYDWEDWSSFSIRNPFKRLYAEVRDRALLRKANAVITASKWLSNRLIAYIDRPVLYLPYACLPREMPDDFQISSKPTAVGMGNLYREWDHDILVDAAFILKRNAVEPSIRYVGDGPDRERLKKQIRSRKLEEFKLLGHLPLQQMLKEIRAAHCLVFPIRNKPLNLARCPFKSYLFAQSGRPIITSRVGEVHSILGDKAIYVEPNSHAYAEAIDECLRLPRQQEVEYDLSSHNWQSRAETLAYFLDSLC